MVSEDNIHIHEEYSHGHVHDHDFALLRLPEHVNFYKWPRIRPICLPEKTDEYYAGQWVYTIGYGLDEDDEPYKLKELGLYAITQRECYEESKYKRGDITENMMCTKSGDSQFRFDSFIQQFILIDKVECKLSHHPPRLTCTLQV